MIGVNADTMGNDNVATVTAFRDQAGVTFPLGFDQTQSYQAFKNAVVTISPYPVDVIVDTDGTIALLTGDYDPEAITAKLDELTR